MLPVVARRAALVPPRGLRRGESTAPRFDIGPAISSSAAGEYGDEQRHAATAEGAAISRVAFVIGEVVFLAAAQVFGGPPWTLVGAVAFVALAFGGTRITTLALLASSLVWLALAKATGNRELFFPYAMHLASVVACRRSGSSALPGLPGACAVVAAFLAIRVAQQATLPVLAVEFAVAAAILAGAALARLRFPRGPLGDGAIVAASAVLACLGLLL